jgi:hypothetical protein
MVDFLKYVNNLRFEQDPNYSFMKGCFRKILTKLNFYKTNINFSWINSKDNRLKPKINLDKRESSRQRILKSLEKNKSKKRTIDTDNNIRSFINQREIGEHIKNTFDENKIKNNIIKNNKKEKNTVLKRQLQPNHIKDIKTRNKSEFLHKNNNSNSNKSQNQKRPNNIQNNKIYINIKNNNIILGYGMNNLNRNMNSNIINQRKIDAFNTANNDHIKKINMNYLLTSRNNNNNYNNYSLNKRRNMALTNNNIINKRYEVENTMNTLNIKNNNNNNNLLSSFDNNKKNISKEIISK